MPRATRAWKALPGGIAYTTFITVFGFAIGATLRGTGAAITLLLAAYAALALTPPLLCAERRDT